MSFGLLPTREDMRKICISRKETEDEEFASWCSTELDYLFCLHMLLICALYFPSDILLTIRPKQTTTLKVKEEAEVFSATA